MVHPDSSGLPRDPPYLGNGQTRLVHFHLRGYHPLWRNFPVPLQLVSSFVTRPSFRDSSRPLPRHRSDNPHEVSHLSGLGLFPFARRYLGNRGCFVFLEVLRCFTPLGLASAGYVFTDGYWSMTPSGLSHSEICGSMPIWRLPAAYRSLSRPSSPPGARTSTIRPL